MLYLVWLPADASAAAALVPDELKPAPGSPVFMNQYVVDDAAQTSNAASDEGFGAYSLTYLGVDLAGLDTEDGTPGRWWTHYFDSSPNMIRYAAAHGVPAGAGREHAGARDGTLVATTLVGGEPSVRTTAHVELGTPGHATGQLRYLTRVDGSLVSGRYPFVMDTAETFEVELGRVPRRWARVAASPAAGRAASGHLRLLLAVDLLLLPGRRRPARLGHGS